MREPEVRPRLGAVAIAMIVVGLVILIPSGLCTTIFAGGALLTMLTAPDGAGGAFFMVPVALIIGGPFIAIGFALVRQGLRRD